ncbi:MAG: ankyrin repeat domain-containing protein, partial [Synechococcales cyanobacterium RM1_1_8]|nr:ankyrin repeat domain-containing protein [Synechococcales cyanobacterium RM1_1_8]
MMGRFTAHLPSAHPLDRQLFEAIALLDLPHLQALLDAGAQANAIAPDSGQTALIAAGRVPTQADAVAIAHLLLARGADGNRRGDRGQTPLMQAASQGYGDLVQLLLEQGARVQTQSDDGETALGLAAGATAWVAVAPSAQPSGILRQTAQGPQQLVPLSGPRTYC